MTGIEELAGWLRERDRVAVLTHIHPDGDALGSSSAICLALRRLGKMAACVCDDPVPEDLAFLPVEAAASEELDFEPQWALMCDAGEESRVGRSAAILERVRGSATLDHHGTGRGVGEIRVIEPNAAAAGVLALALIRALGVEPDRDMALCLYAAIATDTGNFSFRNTDPAALRAAADCLETGIDPDELSFRLFRAKRRQKTLLIGEALHGMRFEQDGKIALIRIDRAMLDRCGAESQDIDNIVNFGMDTEGVEVSVLLEQRGDAVKLSLRSRGDIDVSALAHRLGGGGHRNAAGATVEGAMDEAEAAALRMIRGLLAGGAAGRA